VFACGEIVEDQIAKWALADKSASAMMVKKRRTKNAGAAPENK